MLNKCTSTLSQLFTVLGKGKIKLDVFSHNPVFRINTFKISFLSNDKVTGNLHK